MCVTVLPASSRMIERLCRWYMERQRAPRICGDDPDKTMGFIIRNRCSPHPRG